jgi:hypothetical protein
MDKLSRRTVKVTRQHNEECRRLLGLMGIPVIIVRLAVQLYGLECSPTSTGAVRS